MTSVYLLPELSRYLIALWAFMLCVFGIAVIAYAVFQRRYSSAVVTLIPFACTYLIWQMLLAINLRDGNVGLEIAQSVSEETPWIVWLAVLAAVTLVMALLLTRSIRYDKNHITPNAIKLCAYRMSCGICYWRDNGRVVFSNNCMKRLCILLTNKPLLNGNHFRAALTDGYLTVDGKAWRFVCRDLTLDGEPLHEMIATDVTEEYAKTEMLRKDMEELSRINRELQEHRLKIADTVRKQEILQAKVNIHDEMNRLMLRTVVADCHNKEELASVFSLWKRNALFLCMEAETDKMAVDKIEELAEQMNIRLIWQSELPKSLTDKQRELFFSAFGEAIINAAKHAEAETLTVSFTETDDELSCIFENDGKVSGNIRFTGGLSNLSLLAKEQNASVTAEADKTFRLTMIFSKND